MKQIYTPLLLAGSILGVVAIMSCDTTDKSNEGFEFNTDRFNTSTLSASRGSTAVMPRYLVEGDRFDFNPGGATTSFDEDYVPVMSRHGASLTASGTNLVFFERYQDPALQSKFPALQSTWNSVEGTSAGRLISVDSISQPEIDDFTQFAADNAIGGGVFSNPFTDANGDLDGEISQALTKAGLPDAHVEEQEGTFIEQELKQLGKEIYNNRDTDAHKHGGPVDWREPVLRATVRRIFSFTATSTNADILDSKQITGTYTIQEVYIHLYTHAELPTAPGYINMRMRPGSPFSGTQVIETGTFTLNLR